MLTDYDWDQDYGVELANDPSSTWHFIVMTLGILFFGACCFMLGAAIELDWECYTPNGVFQNFTPARGAFDHASAPYSSGVEL